jgi:hypothetical protein
MSEAAPICISGRTSYLWVRLAFHPYPQLIRPFCNRDRFGRPARVTAPSAWPWVAHPVSGLLPATERPIRTRFRYGCGCHPLSLATEKKLAGPFYKKYAVTPGRKASGLRLRVSVGFQDLFHPPRRGAFHLSLTVLVHYRSCRVFSLGRWSALLPAAFHVDRGTQVQTRRPPAFTYGALTPCGGPFQASSASLRFCPTAWRVTWPAWSGLQPPCRNGRCLGTAWVWAAPGSFATTTGILSLPRGTEMFQFPRCPPPGYGFTSR